MSWGVTPRLHWTLILSWFRLKKFSIRQAANGVISVMDRGILRAQRISSLKHWKPTLGHQRCFLCATHLPPSMLDIASLFGVNASVSSFDDTSDNFFFPKREATPWPDFNHTDHWSIYWLLQLFPSRLAKSHHHSSGSAGAQHCASVC